MRIFLIKIRKVLGLSAYESSLTTKSSELSRRNHWLKDKRPYNELDDVEGQLSGAAAKDIHNNTIALALKERPDGAAAGAREDRQIRVTDDIVVEHADAPVVSSER